MTWEIGESGQVKIVVETPEGTEERLFDSTTKLRDAVVKIAQEFGYNTVIVRDGTGAEIEENEGDKELSQFSAPIRVAPKTVGA